MRGARNLRRRVVADRRRQRGDEHQRTLQKARDIGFIRFNAVEAAGDETVDAGRHQINRLQHGEGDHRLHHIEFEMSLRSGESDRLLIAEHARAHHGDRLDLRRIDLARHDRGAGLVLRQTQFGETGARAAAHQTNIASDFIQAGGERIDGAMRKCDRVMRRERLEFIGRRDKRQAGLLCDIGGDRDIEARRRVDAGADRRAALRQRQQIRQRRANARRAIFRLRRVT